MRKLATILLCCLSGITTFAQTATLGTPPAAMPQENLWTPENLWRLICSVVLMAFIFLVIHALSSAAISLSKQIEKKTNREY